MILTSHLRITKLQKILDVQEIKTSTTFTRTRIALYQLNGLYQMCIDKDSFSIDGGLYNLMATQPRFNYD